MDTYLQRLQDAVGSATRDLSSADLARRAPGKWSVGELLEHLYLTYTGTEAGFRRCLDAARPLASSGTLRQRMVKAVVVGLGHMPGGRKSPAVAVPRGLPPEEVAAKICGQIEVMDGVITQCEARYGADVSLLDHPILGPLTARQWRKLHWVHGKHHLKQIQRLRAK